MAKLEITVVEALRNVLSFIEDEIEQDEQEVEDYFSGDSVSEIITDTKVVRAFIETATDFFSGSETVTIDDKGNISQIQI